MDAAHRLMNCVHRDGCDLGELTLRERADVQRVLDAGKLEALFEYAREKYGPQWTYSDSKREGMLAGRGEGPGREEDPAAAPVRPPGERESKGPGGRESKGLASSDYAPRFGSAEPTAGIPPRGEEGAPAAASAARAEPARALVQRPTWFSIARATAETEQLRDAGVLYSVEYSSGTDQYPPVRMSFESLSECHAAIAGALRLGIAPTVKALSGKAGLALDLKTLAYWKASGVALTAYVGEEDVAAIPRLRKLRDRTQEPLPGNAKPRDPRAPGRARTDSKGAPAQARKDVPSDLVAAVGHPRFREFVAAQHLEENLDHYELCHQFSATTSRADRERCLVLLQARKGEFNMPGELMQRLETASVDSGDVNDIVRQIRQAVVSNLQSQVNEFQLWLQAHPKSPASGSRGWWPWSRPS